MNRTREYMGLSSARRDRSPSSRRIHTLVANEGRGAWRGCNRMALGVGTLIILAATVTASCGERV
jgi:hypothetical protein